MDITRWSHDPRKHYDGVRAQQGRLFTDDDWNVADVLVKEERRATNVDVIGPEGSPDEGFAIANPALKPDGTIDFEIRPGTLYVGGLRLTMEPDATGHGEHFAAQRDWLQQSPAERTGTTTAGHDLVYIEAWQQPVSATEDGELLEAALGGVDTTVRVRTLRRVRILPNVGTRDCAEAWQKFTAAHPLSPDYELITDARLTVTFDNTGAGDDLCTPRVAGGYLGAENQAIRVELVEQGKLVWGFDNGAPLYRAKVAGQTITLLTPPRDQVHWPLAGQTVEILSWSAYLLNGEKVAQARGPFGPTGAPPLSYFAKVQSSYNPDTGQFTVDTPPAASFNDGWKGRYKDNIDHSGTDQYFFLRVWNRGADVSALPANYTQGTALNLGTTGLQITVKGSNIKPGDYWIIAARPQTPRTVVPWQLSEERPPEGPHRYYAPLGILSWSNGQAQTPHDCRPHFKPLTKIRDCCCCTLEVGDGETSHGDLDNIDNLAAALDAASQRVGAETAIRICILPGLHQPTKTIVINRPRVTITGCGRASRVEATSSVPIFDIRSELVRVQYLHLAVRSAPAIVGSGSSLFIAYNELTTSARSKGTENGMIDLQAGASGARVIENRLDSGPGHGITLNQLSPAGKPGRLSDIVIAGNEIRGMRGSGIATSFFFGFSTNISGAVPDPTATTPVYINGLRIEHNTIEDCAQQLTWARTDGAPQGGIVVGGVEHLLIADNRIVDNGANQPQTILLAGIYIGFGRGLIVRDNVLTGNGRQGGVVQRVEGGIVAMDLGLPVEVVGTGAFDTSAASIDPAKLISFFPRPDGWPAAMVHGNLVVSPSGRALTLLGMGPMQVTDNRLISRQFIPIPISDPTVFTGAVLIQSNGSPTGTISYNDGNILFSENEVVLDEATRRSTGSPSPSTEAVAVEYAVMITATNDLAFQNNVIRCLKGALTFLTSNTFLQGATTRVVGNGVYEDGPLSGFPSIDIGRPKDTEICMLTNNQVSHCFSIHEPGKPPQVITGLNQGIFCQGSFRIQALPDVETSRRAMLERITKLTRFEVESLKENRAALSRTGPVDTEVQRIEESIRGAERLQEALEVETRMSDRAKEIQPGDWALMGRVLDTEGQPIAGARLELQGEGRSLTEIKADERGEIFAHFAEKDVKEVFQGASQLKVVIRAADGKMLQTLEQTLTPTADRVEKFELLVDEASAPASQPGQPASTASPKSATAARAEELPEETQKKKGKAKSRSGPRKKP